MNVASVDFSKAFNLVDHMSCLQSLTDLGASNQLLEIICDFLRVLCKKGAENNSRSGDRSGDL